MAADQASGGARPVYQTKTDYHSLPVMSDKVAHLTYRVRGIPPDYSVKKVQELLRSVLETEGSRFNVQIRSMALSPDQKTKTATVNFKIPPACLSLNKNEWSFEIPDTEESGADDNSVDDGDIIPETPRLTIDTHFRGFTVFRSFKNVSEHKVDCIAISGLGGHAFGSFKERAGSHMWLRDSLPSDLPGARIITYGYDTQLHGSNSFQDLEALASAFRLDLQALAMRDASNTKLETKPLIIVAHSLGGLVVKEAIIQMKRDKKAHAQLNLIYGILFFGVPNHGMEITSLIPMAQDQPNQTLLYSLGKESQLLRNQSRDFSEAFDSQDSEIICFYETEMSPTAVRHGTEWKMKGPLSILVDSSSARHGRIWENKSHHCLAINRNHSELVKFSRIDENYERVLAVLKPMASNAASVIPRGVSSTDVKLLEDILLWLSSPDPSTNHERARGLCQENTGQWFIDSEPFSKWRSSDNSFIWLHGIPGCGKTILSSTVIQHMINQFVIDQKTTVVYFYFDFNDQEKQKPENLLSSLLAQLASQCRNLPKALEHFYTNTKSSSDGKKLPPSFDGMFECLISLISQYDQVYICIDALDECNDRKQLLELIYRILGKELTHLHILATSRREWDLECLTDMSSECVDIRSAMVDADIRLYIENQLSTDRVLMKRPVHVKETIMQALMKDAKGMFRWVACQLDVLRTCINQDALEQALNSLPKTLDETYGRILRGIPSERRKDATRILQWLVFAFRPLNIVEVAELLVVDPEKSPEFDIKRRPFDPQDITSYCGSLVTTQISTNEMRLAHYSVKEFLVSDRLTADCQAYRITKQPSSISITKTCLSYLMGAFNNDYQNIYYVLPLAKYAARYWIKHAQDVEDTHINNLDFFIVRFLECDLTRSKWNQIYNLDYPTNRFANHTKTLSPLYTAAHAGLYLPVKILLDHGVDVNAEGGYYSNALQAASAEGHEAVVRLLLEHGADVNAEGGYRGNALQAASACGHDAIVRLLLEHGTYVNIKGGYYSNALYAASAKGHEAIVRLLLEHGADVNAKGRLHGSALQVASAEGHKAIVRLLLEHGADVNIKGGLYGSALQAASERGHDGIVVLLLAHGARPIDEVKVYDGEIYRERSASVVSRGKRKRKRREEEEDEGENEEDDEDEKEVGSGDDMEST